MVKAAGRTKYMLCVAAMFVVAALLLGLYWSNEIEELVDLEEGKNVALSRSFLNAMGPLVPEYLETSSRLDSAMLRSRAEVEEIGTFLESLSKGLPIFRIKIYNLSGITVYSHERDQIGEEEYANQGVLRVIQSGFPESLLTYQGDINAFEKMVEKEDVISTYVPIKGGDGSIKGVFEIYMGVSSSLSHIKDATAVLAVALLFLFGAMLGVLYLVIYNADEAVKRQLEDTKSAEEARKIGDERYRDFAANAAHELRTPLAVMRTQLDNLGNTKVANVLCQDVDMMSRLVEQLMAVTRVDTLAIEDEERSDLCQICSKVAIYLGPLVVEEGRLIEVVGHDGPVMVKGNANALEQAVRNLVENAIRYSSRETTITLEVTDEPLIRVINRGRSIPEEKKKLIFDRFVRSDQRAGGAGLGLAIVSQTVKAHGGHIELEDVASGGSAFTIYLPKLAA
jgi:signal transduction histidine kinase